MSLFLRATLRALTVVGLPILVLAPFTGRGGAAPHRQPTPPVTLAPARPSKLLAGSTLRGGAFLVSSNGRYRLAMQPNGNLVLSWEGHVLWASHTGGHPGAAATMQRDGNFVIYQRRRAIWNSGTSRRGKQGYYLLVQPDGNVVIHTPAGRAIWKTNTSTSGVRAFPSETPAWAADAADPDIIRVGTTYYAFTTGTPLGNHIQALVDLSGDPGKGWHSYTGKAYGSTALPNPPSWQTANTQTSPGVVRYHGLWLMFYDASIGGFAAATGHSCLAVATAASISVSHPVFTDTSKRPLLCEAAEGGVLDPSPFVDPRTGVAYLVWKSNDGSSAQPSRIWAARLDAKGTAIAGPPTLLLYNDTSRFPWESTLDDPNLVFASGRHVMVFSSGNWESASYSEAFAICSSPSGPCRQPPGRPFLSSYGSVAGPAGGSLFTDSSGNWWLAYAGWKRGCTSYTCGGARRLFTAPVEIAP